MLPVPTENVLVASATLSKNPANVGPIDNALVQRTKQLQLLVHVSMRCVDATERLVGRSPAAFATAYRRHLTTIRVEVAR